MQTGKWWEGNFKEGGFTHGMTHGDPSRRGRHGDEGLTIGRQGLQPIYDFVDQCGEKAIFRLVRADAAPLAAHIRLRHFSKSTNLKPLRLHVAKYYAMCEWFDQTCGELLDFLNQKKLDENTLGRLCRRQRLDSESRQSTIRTSEQAIAVRWRYSNSHHVSLARQSDAQA